MRIKITRDPLIAEPVIKSLVIKEHGAVTTFMGTVRLHNEGRTVDYLDYEAYPEMAEEQMRAIAEEVKKMPQVEDVSIVHRIGKLHVGETSLIVAVASKHRREGFNACLHAVERIKELVPIWKKEVWAEGAEWVRSKGA
ncbi:MAG: molybdenum cofactor biosynthesis protein MoaE [Chloroflexi bacterium]|nr:molybdenum cofactor biosynthesis protein MoaE [Chloroflexota bacterium]